MLISVTVALYFLQCFATTQGSEDIVNVNENVDVCRNYSELRAEMLEEFDQVYKIMDAKLLYHDRKLLEELNVNLMLTLRKELKNALNRMELLKIETETNYENIRSDISNIRMLIDKHENVNTKHQFESIDKNKIDYLNRDCSYAVVNNTRPIKYYVNYPNGVYPHSCVDAVDACGSSGIYKIKVGAKPFSVYCEKDPKGGPAWTIIQRRLDGSIDFYRNWQQYKNGFGQVDGEYFLGLERLHQITNTTTNTELWILLVDFKNNIRNARYANFGIGNEQESYVMHTLGKYSGNAGDSLLYHKGSKFTTKDVDNDEWVDGNCAEVFHGAWWYNDTYTSNLNGHYLGGRYSEDYGIEGVTWYQWRGYDYSLKYTHMAIRPAKHR